MPIVPLRSSGLVQPSLLSISRANPFWIEFTLQRPERFEALEVFFQELRRYKSWLEGGRVGVEGDEELAEPDWSALLDEEAQAWCAQTFAFDSTEGLLWQELWQNTDPAIRESHPMFITPGNWSLESIVDSFLLGRFELLRIVAGTEANRLLYAPWAEPFGGTEGMIALLEAFGGNVIHDSRLGGPPPKAEAGWDPKLARRLAAGGSGFVPHLWPTARSP